MSVSYWGGDLIRTIGWGLSLSLVCVCMCVCMCVFVCVCTCVHMRTRMFTGTLWLSVHSLSYRMLCFQKVPFIANHTDLWVGIRWNESRWLSSSSHIMTYLGSS